VKQKRLFLIILFITIMLQACSQISEPVNTPTATVAVVNPVATSDPSVFEPLNACNNFFLPMETGTIRSYSDGTIFSVGGFEGDDATGSIVVLRLNPEGSLEKQYINCSNGKTEIVKVGALDKDLNETGSQTMSEISNGACETQVILPEAENMIPGKVWQQCTTSCHVVNDQTINIQLGSFKTRRVECEDGTIRWFAPLFGLLKTCTGNACSELIEFIAPS